MQQLWRVAQKMLPVQLQVLRLRLQELRFE
jgi:hypothetical protein